MNISKQVFTFLASIILIISCGKEMSVEQALNGPGGGTGGTGVDASCNNTVMKILKVYDASFPEQSTEVGYDNSGKPNFIKISEFLADGNITFIYSGDTITQGVVKDNSGMLVDTVTYHYNESGKVDSISRSGSFKLSYSFEYDQNLHLPRVTEYQESGSITEYFDITCNANGNPVQAVEYSSMGAGMQEGDDYVYEWDNKKNPFSELSIYICILFSQFIRYYV